LIEKKKIAFLHKPITSFGYNYYGNVNTIFNIIILYLVLLMIVKKYFCNNLTLMNGILIRQATVQDATMISELSIATFRETYAEFNTASNMDAYILKHFKVAQLEEEIRDEDQNIFFITFVDEVPAAYVKLSVANSPAALQGTRPIEIERFYVLKPYQEQKLGSTLMSYCLSNAIRKGYETLWLGVWQQNDKAIAFYERWGFEKFGAHIFQLGNDEQSDWLMKRRC
jgi:ribosomal protein S18 acetylase RimI-like enzyme